LPLQVEHKMNELDPTLNPEDLVEVLTFDLRSETFALEAGLVREILDLTSETQVPGAGAFVGAVINFRGKVIPVADLSFAFGLGARETSRDSRIVVVELDLDGDPTLIGLRADKVHEVATLSLASTEAAPRVGMRWRQDYVRCVGRRGGDPLIIPDLACIFAHRGEPGASVTHIHPHH
jgi:purine-binding chemotaxis protein CheW